MSWHPPDADIDSGDLSEFLHIVLKGNRTVTTESGKNGVITFYVRYISTILYLMGYLL